MAGYVFFPAADEAQDEIWRYTCDQWTEKQAAKYIQGLHDHLQELSEKKKFWHGLPERLVVPSDLDFNAYFSKYEHHYVFFRELSGEQIGVMSILHEHADLPVRLHEDLNKLSE